jgi:sugar lactone lactonase YvrE
VLFTEPTSIDLEPTGMLLVVENNPGRLLRVDPLDGHVFALTAPLTRPYAVAGAPSGVIFLSAGSEIQRVEPTGVRSTVVTLAEDIGPLAVSSAGDLYFATATSVSVLSEGEVTPLASGFSNPHGLALAADGSLLVSDTGHQRIARVADGAVTTFAQVGQPDGFDVAADGSVYVVDEQTDRVVHLSASGSRIGVVGPAFATPYDVEAAPGGVTYVLEAGPAGRIRRVAADGTVTTVSRR